MLSPQAASAKRTQLRQALGSGKLLQFPGAYSPLVAMLVEQKHFDGVYVSGAVVANDLGLPDIGLTTLDEVSRRGQQIARVTSLPTLIDVDTGFGGAVNVVRTVQTMEAMGLAGLHLEDQLLPKRCGHLDHKKLVSTQQMCQKLRAAVMAKRDPQLLIIARTDARASEGLEGAIERARAYVAAGAEMIFPEALRDEEEFVAFRQAISVPLLANMTEFGKSPLLGKKQLQAIGYNLAIYPVTTMRLAMHGVEMGLEQLKAQGDQKKSLKQMQTRKRLYEILRYTEYAQFDQDIANFDLNDKL